MGHPDDRYYPQYLVAFSGALAMFSSSAAFAWVSPMLPLLEAADSPIPVSKAEGGWIVFAIMIGRLAGIVPGAWAMDRYGRKRTLLVAGLPMLAGWLVCLMATNVEMLYTFRVLCGVTLGVVHTVVLPMYLGEIGANEVRGSVCSIHGVMAKSGICFSFAIGPFVSFATLAWLEMIPIVLFLVTFVWCPESPYWLLGQHRDAEALRSLQCLRGHREVHEEFKQMRANVEHAEANPIRLRDILREQNRPGLIVTLGLTVGVVMCGTEAILANCQKIFAAINSPLEPRYSSLITGGVLMATTFVAAATVDRVGRRPLMLGSTLGLFVCNLVLAVYLAMSQYEVDFAATAWIAMCAVFGFVISYGMGLATVTFAIIGEILPKDMKAVAGCMFGVVVSVLSMLVMKGMQMLGSSVGYWVMYVVFTISSALFFPFVWFYIPETKGKPLNEILAMMEQKRV